MKFMFRRILSGLVINAAVFLLTATFLIWLLDSTVLAPGSLTKALRDSGTNVAIAKAIPELATKGLPPQDVAVAKPAIEKIATPQYIESKLSGVIDSFIAYVKDGSTPPELDLSDIPGKLKAANLTLPKEQEELLAKPIKLTGQNSDKTFGYVNKTYAAIRFAKIAGPLFITALLILEWFVADKRYRFSSFGRIFFAVGIWAMFLWFGLNKLESVFRARATSQAAFKAESDVLGAVINGANVMLSRAFIVYGIVCLSLSIVAWILHFVIDRKHFPKPSQEEKEALARQTAMRQNAEYYPAQHIDANKPQAPQSLAHHDETSVQDMTQHTGQKL